MPKDNIKGQSETNYARGVRAEIRAQDYLKQQGYDILETRYKTKFGEIDIIAGQGDCLCFVEVKARQDISDALYSVTPRSRKRIEQSALYYIAQNECYIQYGMRFDVIALTKDFEITHLDNAWFAEA